MDDRKDTQIERPDDEGGRRQKKPSKLRQFFKRFFGLILTFVVVLGLIFTAMLQDTNYLDRIRRWLLYGESTLENMYAFAADGTNRFGQVDDLLVVVSQNYIQFLRDDGTAYYANQIQLNQPALDIGGGLVVAYDIGGEHYSVYSKNQQLLEVEQDEGYGIISARLNSSGYLAVVSEKSGYKGAVSVYNEEQELLFSFNSSSQFLIDAVVTEDCSHVLVAALGQENGRFCTRLISYRLDKEEAEGETLLTDHLIMDLGWIGSSYASVSDSELIFIDSDGSETGSFSYRGLYLRQYTLGGNDFVALLLNRYQAGSIGTLTTVDESGEAIATLDVTQEILDISAAGNYLAVLYSNSLVIYNQELEEYSRLDDTGYANQVIMCDDGSALVIGGNTAFRYLP